MLFEFQIDKIAEKILYISYMWFGSKGDGGFSGPHEDMAVYDILENRILSRGVIKKETDAQALELTRQIERELEKQRRRDKLESIRDGIGKRWQRYKRTLSWIFPEYHYMRSMYPWLEKAPVLLPVSWMVRGMRLLAGFLKTGS